MPDDTVGTTSLTFGLVTPYARRCHFLRAVMPSTESVTDVQADPRPKSGVGRPSTGRDHSGASGVGCFGRPEAHPAGTLPHRLAAATVTQP